MNVDLVIVALNSRRPLPGYMARQSFLRQFAGLGIYGKYLFYRFRMAVGGFTNFTLNYLRNIAKTYFPFQESGHSHLVGGVQRDGLGASGFSGLIGQAQARELAQVGRREIQALKVQDIETQVRRDPLGISQSIEDGQAHVSDRELRQNAAIIELD